MTPSSFRSLRLLEHLNVAAVGLALAAGTAAFFGSGNHDRWLAFYTGLPTLALGTLWARLLRSPRTLQGTSLRVGWLLSVPLAAANAGLAAALLFGVDRARFDLAALVGGFFAGATLGVVIWGPALLLTLLCFGLPLAWSQRLARQGLAGQERGELVVGVACALLAMAAAALGVSSSARFPTASLLSLGFIAALAAAAVVCGGLAVAMSVARARSRRSFVAAVEAGEVPRYRIEATPAGRALVRVVVEGGSYRVVDIEEEVAALDRDGHVTRTAQA